MTVRPAMAALLAAAGAAAGARARLAAVRRSRHAASTARAPWRRTAPAGPTGHAPHAGPSGPVSRTTGHAALPARPAPAPAAPPAAPAGARREPVDHAPPRREAPEVQDDRQAGVAQEPQPQEPQTIEEVGQDLRRYWDRIRPLYPRQ
ncbi:hypothetical protein [Streptomyces sp. NPDC002644]